MGRREGNWKLVGDTVLVLTAYAELKSSPIDSSVIINSSESSEIKHYHDGKELGQDGTTVVPARQEISFDIKSISEEALTLGGKEEIELAYIPDEYNSSLSHRIHFERNCSVS